MRFRTLLAASLITVAAWAATEPTDSLFRAAREGDTAGVEEALATGLAIDSVDRYGSTALSMAAANGHAEVVAVLLEKGADPDIAETFYNSRPVDSALFFGHVEVAELLLRGGAEGRETALRYALDNDLVSLAEAALDSGPIYETDLERLRATADLTPETSALLATARSRPDPDPPTYALDELHAHTGIFEGWDSDLRAEIWLREGTLLIALDERRAVELVPLRGRTFQTRDGSVEATFFGRAGMIEGIALARAGSEPERLRRSVAEPVDPGAGAALAEAPKPDRDPVVHWPGFRGTNADGIGDGVDTPSAWDLDSGEAVRWRIAIPGLGNSSPVVWGDRIYITTAVASGTEQTLRTGLTGSGESVDEAVPHRWSVLAYDKWSGEPVWETEVGTGVPLTERHFKATQANSTAATDGRYLVVVFPTAGLACLDLDGRIVWKQDLGGLNAGAFSNPTIQWGFASSPVIVDDLVILQVDIHEGAYLAAWDLATGERVWKVERDVAPSWATPAVLPTEGGSELVVNGSTIHGYDPRSGEELWSLGPNSELVIATPIVGDDVVYVSAGYPPIKPIYAVRAGTRGDLEVEPGTAHDRLLWSQRRGGAYMPSPLLYGGRLFIVHHNGRLVVYDSATGAPLHKARFSRGGVFTASPIAVNQKLYAATEEGLVYVLDTRGSYEELAVNEMGEPVMATPAVSEGLLIIRTPAHLTAIAEPAG